MTILRVQVRSFAFLVFFLAAFLAGDFVVVFFTAVLTAGFRFVTVFFVSSLTGRLAKGKGPRNCIKYGQI
ncbi:hypothetical protein PE36_05118 [Moritella sp. PE36]|nr:hypothetical protein PE36_05118 [Moritella sp. PE36]